MSLRRRKSVKLIVLFVFIKKWFYIINAWLYIYWTFFIKIFFLIQEYAILFNLRLRFASYNQIGLFYHNSIVCFTLSFSIVNYLL